VVGRHHHLGTLMPSGGVHTCTLQVSGRDEL
jgi:hypothetical protein